MPIRRRRADAGKARGLRESKSRRPFSGDQFQRRADQRLAQIAVMIAARRVALAGFVLAPTHVKGIYIMSAGVSMLSDLRLRETAIQTGPLPAGSFRCARSRSVTEWPTRSTSGRVAALTSGRKQWRIVYIKSSKS